MEEATIEHSIYYSRTISTFILHSSKYLCHNIKKKIDTALCPFFYIHISIYGGISMTIRELQAQGAIYLTNIQDGFHSYASETLILNEQRAFLYFQERCRRCNYQNTYVDFYYYTLDSEAQERVRMILTPSEQDYLQKNAPDSPHQIDEIIFPLTEELLVIICKLNASATLFSTIYYTDIPLTYWGNYNQEYIVFGTPVVSSENTL